MHRRVDGTIPPHEMHAASTEWAYLLVYATTLLIVWMQLV